jgi:hypothetical protein
MASDLWTTGPVDVPADQRSNRKLVLWLLLIAPLLIYLLIVPVRARLDQGVIERHLPYEIWEAMIDGLPGTDAGWFLELAFVVGGLVFLAGTLLLIRLALDESQPAPEPPAAYSKDVDNLQDGEPEIQAAS